MDVHLSITETISSMLHAIDALDWEQVRASFADRVEIDYTSLFGGEPATLALDDLLANWKNLLPGFEATQHLTGPVVVRRAGAKTFAETHVRGYHSIAGAEGGNLWMVAGHYTLRMVQNKKQWKIAALKLTVFYQEGNLKLPEVAQGRAKTSPRKR